MNIPIRVKNLIKKWGTRNPKKLCKYLGIDIMYLDLGDIKGYYKKSLHKKIIVLNENLDELSSVVVLAHELGHALLHSNREIKFMKDSHLLPKTSIYENQANKFAAELILNEDFNLEIYGNSKLNQEILRELKALKKIP